MFFNIRSPLLRFGPRAGTVDPRSRVIARRLASSVYQAKNLPGHRTPYTLEGFLVCNSGHTSVMESLPEQRSRSAARKRGLDPLRKRIYREGLRSDYQVRESARGPCCH